MFVGGSSEGGRGAVSSDRQPPLARAPWGGGGREDTGRWACLAQSPQPPVSLDTPGKRPLLSVPLPHPPTSWL